jgi:two-component system sensor histidine kinase RegB
MPTLTTDKLLNASWLFKLRWVAVAGQLITIAAVGWGLRIELPWGSLLAIIAATVTSNLLLGALIVADRGPRPMANVDWDRIMGIVSAMDMMSLTALLYATGGATNPFTSFFFVNLCLSAVLLSSPWAWSMNILAIVCFGWLLYDHHQISALQWSAWLEPVRYTQRVSLIQFGLWLAFSTCSSVLVYFLTRLTSALRQQQFDLRRVQQVRSDMDKFEALATLAAGTAHELATPMSTIAVVAREVEQAIDGRGELQQAIVDDVHLIRSELERCRKILHRMSSHAGQTVGEVIQATSWARIWQEVVESLAHSERVQFRGAGDPQRQFVAVPLAGLAQAIRGIIQNALDAGAPGDTVLVELDRVRDTWQLHVIDQGCGMSEDVLKRVSEPFFTTKPPGQGMGLGVFLARGLVRRLGGDLLFRSKIGVGTRVTLVLPIASENAAAKP